MNFEENLNENKDYLHISNEEIDKLTKDLSQKQLVEIIKLYNDELVKLNQSVEHWKYMACCDAMTTGSMNDSEEFDSCDRKIYSRSYWEEIYRPTHQDLEADCYLIDLNDLKRVNDTNGHHEGDKLICDCAKLLCQFGMVVRLGGDEFFLIVDENKESYFKRYLIENEDNLSFAYGYYHKKPYDPFSCVLKKTDNYMYKKKQLMKTKSMENLKRKDIG